MTPSPQQDRQQRPFGMRESAIHRSVMNHWAVLGKPNTLVATIPNQKAHGQYGLTKGLPDLIVCAPGLPIGFIELKRDGGRLSEPQRDFAELCAKLGIPHEVTYGRDEPVAVLERWNVVRSTR